MIELGRLVCSVRDCEAHPILACSVKFFCQEHADIHLRDETKKLYRSQKKENAAHPPRLCPGVGDDSKHFTESLKDAMMIRKKVATTAISIRWAKESEVSDVVEGTEQQASGSGRDLLVGSGSGREGPEPETELIATAVEGVGHGLEEVQTPRGGEGREGNEPQTTTLQTADDILTETRVLCPPCKIVRTPSSVPLEPVSPTTQAPPAPPFPQPFDHYMAQPPPFVSVHFVISEDGLETMSTTSTTGHFLVLL